MLIVVMKGNIGLKLRNIPPELIFVIVGLIYGLAFLFIIPPFQGFDEDGHFFKAMGLSEGQWMPEKTGDKVGIYVSEGTWELVNAFWPSKNIYFKEKLEVNDITSKLNISQNNKEKHFADLSGMAVAVYSPVPYIIPAFAIMAGKFFNLPPLVLMYLARLANLIIWLLMAYLAIRITPVYKWALLTLALVPMAVFEAASVSSDGLTIGLSFLMIAYILKLALGKGNFVKTDFFILVILGLLIALTKSIYILLFFLFLLIPVNKFKSHKMKYGLFFILFILTGLASVGWIWLTNGLYVPIFSTWSVTGQINFIFGHLFYYLTILFKTVVNYGIYYLIMFVGDFGVSNVFAPFILVVIYFLMLIFVALVDKNEFKISLKQKLICLMIFIVTATTIFTFEYLTWNPVGYNNILGVQGRYFIPIAPLLLLVFYNKRETILIFNKELSLKMNNYYNVVIIGSIALILSLILLLLINRYFII